MTFGVLECLSVSKLPQMWRRCLNCDTCHIWGVPPSNRIWLEELSLQTQTSLRSLFLVLLGWDFNLLVSELGAVNWLWPFMVLGQIYGRSNFGQNFCQLTLLAKIMAKIWDAINLAQCHKWLKPVYCPKIWHRSNFGHNFFQLALQQDLWPKFEMS